MGSKSKSKDRGYIKASEWAEEWGGFKEKLLAKQQRLPFFCCALTFTPFTDPVVTMDGYVFELTAIVPYVQKNKTHPVTGEPLELKQLTPLTFHKNAENEYHCPVLNKVFTSASHIVANRVSGHVYSYQAVQELCLKSKNLRDLMTDEPFTRKDLLVLQDPQNLAAGLGIDEYDFVKRGIKVPGTEAETGGSLRNISADTQRALAGALDSKTAAAAMEAGGGGKRAQAERLLLKAKAEAAAKESGKEAGKGADSSWLYRAPERTALPSHTFKPGAHTWATDEGVAAPAPVPAALEMGSRRVEKAFHTTGAAARSFTSTVAAVETRSTFAEIYVQRTVESKGYVRLETSAGDLNLEVHADLVPQTSENFLGLCRAGRYDGTIFHRSIKNFMVQGGDPTGTGTGGDSFWGGAFKDEFHPKLRHNARGVVAMANSGKDSNKQQFYILYKSAPHLDNKHSVFATVVGGLNALAAMERAATDAQDRPTGDGIKIIKATVFADPFEEADKAEAEAERKANADAEERERREAGVGPEGGSWWSNPAKAAGELPALAPNRKATSVGRYLKTTAAAPTSEPIEDDKAAPPTKKPKLHSGSSFGPFDAW
mmetsp:Transcript_29854/g.97215  ORF Transcript_29854/g.97215 Transcript_29854/m.97215 type:complete len:599 (-) Transcript_29854:471-2267(-)